MEQSERNLILNNLSALLKITEYDEMVLKCQEKELLSSVMVRNIENDAKNDDKEKHRRLYIKITERGPSAFEKLLEICKECGYNTAHQILQQGSSKQAMYAGHDIDIKVKKQEALNNNKENRPPVARKPGMTELPVPNFYDQLHKNQNGQAEARQIILQPYEQEVASATNFVVKKGRKIMEHDCTDSIPLGTYKMRSPHRGVLFLVNIIEFCTEERRNGAEIDKDSLIDVFRQMGFKIFYYQNLRSDEFDKLVSEFSKSNHLRKPECMVFALLTHGNMIGSKAVVTFSDGGLYEVERIIEKFSNVHCDYLLNKPKIFLFPFCRGDAPDGGFRTQTASRKSKHNVEFDAIEIIEQRFPSYSDIAICYASVPGFQTHRDPIEGSWYIQKFCSVLAEYAHIATFEQMLKKIDDEVSKMESSGGTVQTSSFESRGFSKVLYFNPGVVASSDSLGG